VTIAATPDCGDSDLCKQIFDWTHQAWLAESSYVVLVKPFRILLIVVIAMIARRLLHRTIDRLVRSTAEGSVPPILKPLKERIPSRLQDPDAAFPERRRQRAEAIGSVLRSFVTVAVYSIGGLMILQELAINVAPLIASAGIVGVALGFGAQTLVKDLIAGLFMLLEDQYGVGDTVDLGEATGVVEAVGLRITTLRDARGVLWYIRNGEIIRVGNKSQGWSMVVVDMPIGFVSVEDATAVLRRAVGDLADDPEYADDLIDPPEVLGVEQLTVDGTVVRAIAKTPAESRIRIDRELRRRLTDALETSGIAAQIANSRAYGRPIGPGTDAPFGDSTGSG
jgi:small conductance mechanosensitive channel